jgi:hypothetical protein
MKRRISVVLVAAVAALGVASCGGDDEDTTTTSATTTTTTTGPTGPTGDEGASTDDPEGTDAVNDVIVSGLTAQGYSQGEAECLADLLAADFAGADIDEVQDPNFLSDLQDKYASEVQECEGQ